MSRKHTRGRGQQRNDSGLQSIDQRLQAVEQFLPAKLQKLGSEQHFDGWYNGLVGLGKAFDKSNKTFFGEFVFMDRNQLSRMYVGDGLGRKIIDIVADDMTREWITINMEDEDQVKVLEDTMKKLKAEVYFNEALKWERLFGGSIIVLGAMDGKTLDNPMDIRTVKSIEWLKVIDMWDIDLPSSEWDRDPTSPTYGQVIRYMVQFRVSGTGRIDRLLVHNTRVLPFYGENIPKSLVMGDQRTRYWGASVLQAIWESLANLGGAMQAVTNMIYEFIIGKYTFTNLIEMLSSGNEGKLFDRMSAIQMSKSVINAVMLNEGETYQRDSANVAGLAELIDRLMMFVSGICSIPVTRLFGRSPAGMNATGESDLSTYYDGVRSKQKTDLQPNLSKFVIMLAQVLKFTEQPSIEFNPLRQNTPKEEAEIKKLEADTELAIAQADQIYIANQVASPEEIALKREFITEDEYNLLREDIPEDIAVEEAEAKLKARPSEGSAVSPQSGAMEKNLIDREKGKGESSALSKTTDLTKKTSSAVPPIDNPGSSVY